MPTMASRRPTCCSQSGQPLQSKRPCLLTTYCLASLQARLLPRSPLLRRRLDDESLMGSSSQLTCSQNQTGLGAKKLEAMPLSKEDDDLDIALAEKEIEKQKASVHPFILVLFTDSKIADLPSCPTCRNLPRRRSTSPWPCRGPSTPLESPKRPSPLTTFSLLRPPHLHLL